MVCKVLDNEIDIQKCVDKFETVDYDVETAYRYCFGIISPDDVLPQEIVLSFAPFQGKYIKTLPLHHTQEGLVDNGTELKIRLQLCLTHDFLMELLSFGHNMEVLKPALLADELKWAHYEAYRQYESI